jgi:hypothetical protein
MFYSELKTACGELIERGAPFDVVQVRDRIRELRPHDNVLFREVKYELYTYFEQGNMPGFIIGTKNVIDDSGFDRNVIEFRPEVPANKPKSIWEQMHGGKDADFDLCETDAHTEHCCKNCGCNYGDADCSLKLGRQQERPCGEASACGGW